MNSIQFCYWLKGAIEMNHSDSFSIHETQTIKNNLESVFTKDEEYLPFCNFLQGYFILSKPEILDKEVIQLMKERLDNVCKVEIEKANLSKQQNSNSQNKYPEVRAMC